VGVLYITLFKIYTAIKKIIASFKNVEGTIIRDGQARKNDDYTASLMILRVALFWRLSISFAQSLSVFV
jgi:hypothetical protein